jgi:UDP-N-acetylglucosamine acyltransferase
VVTGWTTLGERCTVHPFAVLGGAPQDRKYRDERSELVVGAEVVVREHATVHCGTAAGSGRTTIGDRTLLMAYTHVAHDCAVGSDVVMTNGATLAGHVTVEDHAVLGGFAAVGQLLRVGESAMLAAGAMVEQDVPPFCTVAGDRARVRAVNVVGLRRRGLDAAVVSEIRRAFRVLFRSGEKPLAEAIRSIREAQQPPCAEVERLLAFVEASRKGVCR